MAQGPSTHPSTSFSRPSALAEQAHGLDAVAHARGDGGIGQRQARQGGFFSEQGAALDDGGRLVIEPLDGRSQIGGLAGRVGDG